MFHQIETNIFEFVKFWGLQVSFLESLGKLRDSYWLELGTKPWTYHKTDSSTFKSFLLPDINMYHESRGRVDVFFVFFNGPSLPERRSYSDGGIAAKNRAKMISGVAWYQFISEVVDYYWLVVSTHLKKY